jgi:hypothetical protein
VGFLQGPVWQSKIRSGTINQLITITIHMKFNASAGQASRVIIILAVVVLIMSGVVYGITRYALSRGAAKPVSSTEIPQPVYDATIGDIKFTVDSARNMGSVLAGKASRFPNAQPDIVTTEKFIKVTVKAQNKGKNDTVQYTWDLGNIVDSEGRNFVPITEKAYSWVPFPDMCGAALKPEFEPSPCVRYYEVSKASEGLKLQVMSK